MEEQSQSGQILSAVGVRLHRGEKVRSLLALGTGSDEGQPPKEGCFVLTDQRLLHIPAGAAQSTLQSVPLRDVAAARVEKGSRYLGFLVAAGFAFIIGIPFLAALSLSGAFSGAVLGAVLVTGGLPLAGWWYSGGDTIVRVITGGHSTRGRTYQRQAERGIRLR